RVARPQVAGDLRGGPGWLDPDGFAPPEREVDHLRVVHIYVGYRQLLAVRDDERSPPLQHQLQRRAPVRFGDAHGGRHQGHRVELAARAVRAGARHVVAVGGDGTVHEVANGLLHATGPVGAQHGAPLLGVVPIGTGNDFAKLVGVYRHAPVHAVQRLVTARPVAFDVGRVFDEYFVNSAGVGFG